MLNKIAVLLGALLRNVYNIVSSIGTEPEQISYYAISLIVTTLIFKLLMTPLTIKQNKSMRITTKIQPQLQALQKKYENDPENLRVKMTQLYQEHNYSPMSGCLPLLVQMPILFAFLKVMREPTAFAFLDTAVYEAMHKNFFWISNLNLPDPNKFGLPLIAAAATFLQSYIMQRNAEGEAAEMQKSMMMMFPIMIYFSGRRFAAGLTLYWAFSILFSVIESLVINKVLDMKEEKEIINAKDN